MNCQDCQLWIPEYTESVLAPDVRCEFLDHLAGCAACQAELRAFERLAAAARQLPVAEPGDETVLRITETILAAEPPRRRSEFGPVLDAAELADYLHVAPATLQDYLPELPSFELGGKLLFRRKSIETWLEGRERGFATELSASAVNVTVSTRNATPGGVPWTT